ncbi:MAG: hypothetical protein Q4A78_01525 [Peptostreptococcaceae bacterium]|nr:hypothetical protein [Peptostreptococcaceae bacterium]
MTRISGFFASGLLLLLLSPYLLRILGSYFPSVRPRINTLIKGLKTIHPFAGFCLLIVGAIHGYIALGGFRLHTGSLLYLAVFMTAFFGGFFKLKKKKILLQLHRGFVLLIAIFWAIHFLFPSALYYLLR